VNDWIELHGLRVVAICGVLDEERARAQPLQLDLDVEVAANVAATSDDVGDTADYAVLCDAAVAALEGAQPRLLEAACEVVGRAVLGADHKVLSVTVAIAKLHPPVPHDLATVAVRRRVDR
jgi:7,8-dihydroneopterin aldolase/epimerase/oxygenase